MEKYLLDIDVLLRVWARGPVVAEAIRLPSFTTAASSDEGATRRLGSRLKKEHPKLDPVSAMRMRGGTDCELGRFEMELKPPRQSFAWQRSVFLRVNYVSWRAGGLLVAYLPTFDHEVLLEDESQLHERLEDEVRSALNRSGVAEDLRHIWPLSRERSLQLASLAIPVTFNVSEQSSQSRQKAKEAAKSLSRIATQWKAEALAPCFYRDEEVEDACRTLESETPRSLLLVGKSGVGKTAVAREVVRSLSERKVWATSGSRLMAGMCGFGMWQERCDHMIRDARAAEAILHLGSLVELSEAGRWRGQRGIASYLRPAIHRGELLAIAECTEEQFDRLDREEPQLRQCFEAVRITQPDAKTQTKMIRAVSQHLARQLTSDASAELLTSDGLEQLQRLHRRFGTYSVSPGRELQFLETLCRDRVSEFGDFETLDAQAVSAAFSRQTGLPGFLLDDQQTLDIPKTEDFFRSRVIGQDHVVGDVVDMLAMVKSQLTHEEKPIASMLFVGPTGVGKTEMAKSLAEYLFQDPSRLVRIDMSEMNTPLAVERLVGGVGQGPGLLVKKMREQPFCVLLLDEFEKSDPLVFDLLLQVLGEGRLTDADGRRADFSNCVVIMTSNLGVDTFRTQPFGFNADDRSNPVPVTTGIEADPGEQIPVVAEIAMVEDEAEAPPSRGLKSARTRYSEHFVRKTQEFLRPELFNRIDRIVAFSPLGREETKQIARRHLELIKRREGLGMRGVQLDVSDDVIEHLARVGFHPRYGARELHRAFERELLRPLAIGLSEYSAQSKLEVTAGMRSGVVSVKVRAQTPQEVQSLADRPAPDVTARVTALRRNGQALDQCTAVLKARNKIEKGRQSLRSIERRIKRKPKSAKLQALRAEAIRQIESEEKRLGGVKQIVTAVHELETQTLLSAYGKSEWNPVTHLEDLEMVEGDLRTTLLDFAFESRGNFATTIVYFERADDAACLLRAWLRLAEKNGWKGRGYALRPYDLAGDEDPFCDAQTPVSRTPGDKLTPALRLMQRKQGDEEREPHEKILDAYYCEDLADLVEPDDGVIGWAVQWQGERVHALLGAEAGQHTFRRDGDAGRLLVEVSKKILVECDAPLDIHRAGADALTMAEARRFYDFETRKIDDVFLGQTVGWGKGKLTETIIETMNQGLEIRLWKMLEDDTSGEAQD